MEHTENVVEIPQEPEVSSEIQQEQPVEVAAPVETPAPAVKPAGKFKYIFKLAPGGKKVIAILGMVIALLATVLMGSTYSKVMDTQIMEIPLFSFTGSLVKMEYDWYDMQSDMKENSADLAGWIEDNRDSWENRYSEESIKVLEDYVESQAVIGEHLSISNYQEYMKVYDKLINDPISDELDFDYKYVGGKAEMENIAMLWNVYGMVIMVLAIICAALVFFGGMFRITPLVCIGLGISVLYSLVFCGFMTLLISLVLNVILIVFNVIVNKGYRNYRNSLKQAA